MSSKLQPVHQQMLIDSGISPKITEARGCFSADAIAVATLGFKGDQCRSGLVFPNYGVDGQFRAYELRADEPRIRNGRPVKYDRVIDAGNYLDVHPFMADRVRSANETIVITEGSKKVDALATQGVAALGLKGIWGWRGKNKFGANGVIADFEEVAIRDNKFIILFDSDIKTNTSIRDSALRLKELLLSKIAASAVIKLLPYAGEQKRGVDDWITEIVRDKKYE